MEFSFLGDAPEQLLYLAKVFAVMLPSFLFLVVSIRIYRKFRDSVLSAVSDRNSFNAAAHNKNHSFSSVQSSSTIHLKPISNIPREDPYKPNKAGQSWGNAYAESCEERGQKPRR